MYASAVSVRVFLLGGSDSLKRREFGFLMCLTSLSTSWRSFWILKSFSMTSGSSLMNIEDVDAIFSDKFEMDLESNVIDCDGWAGDALNDEIDSAASCMVSVKE